MKFCARAPVRVDPAGGGTDAPPFSVEYGGSVVNFAVARYAYAEVTRLPQGQGITIRSRDLGREISCASVEEVKFDQDMDFLKAFVRRLVPHGDSVLLVTDSEIPERSGLGGSGALGVAVTAALSSSYGKSLTSVEIAELANDIERTELGAAGGNQDSYGAALGGVNFLTYAQGGGTSYRKLKLSPETLSRFERDSLLVNTGERHLSGTIHADIKRSYEQKNSPTKKALHALRQAAEQMAEALESGNLEGYAEAMNASNRSLYALHSSCNSPTLEKFFKAMEDLILGAKTCGAGGGGFILFLAKPGYQKACTEAAEKIGGTVWPVRIEQEGVKAWTEPAA